MILAPGIDVESISSVRRASTVLRAVENRVAMVKADAAWDSVIVAPNGQVLASDDIHTQLGGPALLVADVPLGPRGAPFTRYGGWPFQWLAYALTAVMAGAMFASWRRNR
jgi:apolipoprotein N-acyltransferase